jgi:hypothetical protein
MLSDERENIVGCPDSLSHLVSCAKENIFKNID